MFNDVSQYCKDHFDFVIDDSYIYRLPDSPNRWPDVGCGASEDPDDAPEIVEVPTSEYFIASQPTVYVNNVKQYAIDLKGGDDMPPVAAIKCPDGYIVWNGHHRLAAHRLAGKKTVKIRVWAELNRSVKEWEDHRAY